MLNFKRMGLNVNILQESASFALKNLVDCLNNSVYNDVQAARNKINTVIREYESRYKIDEEVKSALVESILDFNKKNQFRVEILDIPKVEKYHHLGLILRLEFGKYFKSEKTVASLYNLYYAITFSGEYPSYYTKYTLPLILNDRYLVYITFDENEIETVESLASPNMLDVQAPVFFVPLKVNKSIFKKV